MSLSAFATAMAPHAAASSTMGVKKSTVATSARSGDSKNTAASSLVVASIKTRGSPILGRRRRTCARSAEPSLQAQPAPCERAVRRIRGFWSMGVSAIQPPFLRSLAVVLGPDQRAQGNPRPFLLSGGSEAAVGTLACQQSGDGSAHRPERLRSPERQQRLQSVKEIGAGPGAVADLMSGYGGRESGVKVGAPRQGDSQGVHPCYDRIARKVSVPGGPLLLELEQAGEMSLDPGPRSETPEHGGAKRQAANGKPGGKLGPEHLSVREHDRREPLFRGRGGKESGDEMLAEAVGMPSSAAALMKR